jgi:hypothetical protein
MYSSPLTRPYIWGLDDVTPAADVGVAEIHEVNRAIEFVLPTVQLDLGLAGIDLH